jgi:hypothetical protein
MTGRRDRTGVLDSRPQVRRPAGITVERVLIDNGSARSVGPGATPRRTPDQALARDKSPTATHQQQMCNSTAPCSTKGARLT